MMNNILEMSLEEIRIENEKLYNNFIERCKDLKPKLRQIKEGIQTNERMSEEKFYNEMNIEESDANLYKEYLEYVDNVDNVCREISSSLANLSWYETELGGHSQDSGNLNKALVYHFSLKSSHNYIDCLYERFNDYLVEIDASISNLVCSSNNNYNIRENDNMMNINKVLEILNNDDYIKIEEFNFQNPLCVYSESRYTVTLKEGGCIKISQFNASEYKIELFVPIEKKGIASWTFCKERKGWFAYKYVKDPLYDKVEKTFNNVKHKFNTEKINEYSKYFPQ